MDLIRKIALGTVQFGLDYGINNSQGQVPMEEVGSILELCQEKGIDILDTAYAYGNSEERLGQLALNHFGVVSKLPPCDRIEVRHLFEVSLAKLKKNTLYGYMFHNFSIYEKDKGIWGKLQQLKDEERIEKIGVSLYAPSELEKLWKDNVDLDIVQVPFNLFDQRFQPYLKEMKDRGIEIHTRSTFLQGLFFKKPDELPSFFDAAKPNLRKLNGFIDHYDVTKVEACLGWVLQQADIDKVVIGVDSYSQLLNNIKSIDSLKEKNIDWDLFASLSLSDTNIINPSNWKV